MANNWVYNVLTLNGSDVAIKNVLNHIKGDGAIDFNKVIEIPSYLTDDNELDGNEGWTKSVKCVQKWCQKNWGTKWIARGACMDGNRRICFETIDDIPSGVMQHMSEKFTQVQIELDSDYGNGNIVHNIWKKGNKVEIMQNSEISS